VRIDAHHHLWRYVPQEFPWIERHCAIARDFLLPDLLAELDPQAIDGCIAVQARQQESETEWLTGLAARTPRILGVVGWVDLRSPDIEARLDRLASAHVVGFRHVVQDEADERFLLEPDFIHGVRCVAQRGLTYDLLVNRRQLPHVPAFLDAVGTARFVLDHAAKPDIKHGLWSPWARDLAAVAANPTVFCKVSGLVTEADPRGWTSEQFEPYLDHVFGCFGPDRIIWGSDWPVCRLAASYGQVLELIAGYVRRHCPGYLGAVLGGTARRAYALSAPLRGGGGLSG
jgi:L-fuconolactonase